MRADKVQLMLIDIGTTVICRSDDATFAGDEVSKAATENVYVPSFVGAPEKTPAPDMVIPGGNEPDPTLNVTVPRPPWCPSDALYAAAIGASGNDDVVIDIGTTVISSSAVAAFAGDAVSNAVTENV